MIKIHKCKNKPKDIDISIEDGRGFLEGHVYGEDWLEAINYCPYCGKELSKE